MLATSFYNNSQEQNSLEQKKSPKKGHKRRFSAGKDLSKLGESDPDNKDQLPRSLTSRMHSVRDLHLPDLTQLAQNDSFESNLFDFIKRKCFNFLKKEQKQQEEIKINILSTNLPGENNENSDNKTTKVAHLSHFSKPQIKEIPKEKEHRIESLEDISEKESVGLPTNSLNAISETSKSRDISETGGSSDFKEFRKKPNLHIFTQNVENLMIYQKFNKISPDQRSKFIFNFL